MIVKGYQHPEITFKKKLKMSGNCRSVQLDLRGVLLNYQFVAMEGI